MLLKHIFTPLSYNYPIFKLMFQLHILTPEKDLPNEIPTIAHMLEVNNYFLLHIRKPTYNDFNYQQYLEAIPSSHHHRIVLHGAYHLLPQYSLHGAHLNTTKREDKTTLQYLNATAPNKLSTSFHSWGEIQENQYPYQFVFISPLFDSISKSGYQARINPAHITHLRTNMNISYCPNIIALGGINAAHLPKLATLGYNGAAMLGYIWQSPNPISALQAALSELHKQA